MGENTHFRRFRDTEYYVSPEGTVVSLYRTPRNARHIHPRIVGKGKTVGYHCVKPRWNKSGWFVHQMVMECYGPPKPDGDYVVDHINEDKTDNRIENLQWLLRGENVAKSDKHTYPQELREEILSQYKPRVMSFNKLATKYDIPMATIKYWYYN